MDTHSDQENHQLNNTTSFKRPNSKTSTLRPRTPYTPSPSSLILPHTTEAGNPYYIGDVYSRVGQNSYIPNHQHDPVRPYYSYLRRISQEWPYMAYLADFMETTCAPPKRHLLTEPDRRERSARFKVSLLDIGTTVKVTNLEISADLELALQASPQIQDIDNEKRNRLFVVEDLSRDVIETLGSNLKIDPTFFRGHISDYLWYNIRDPWVELPQLNLTASRREFFNVRYVQPRYFRGAGSAARARQEAGGFNVLRRIDFEGSGSLSLDEPGSTIGLIRGKLSFWVGLEGAESVLLVDPPITEGYRLWNACNNFAPFRGINSRYIKSGDQITPRMSMFDEFIYWTELLPDEVSKTAKDSTQDPRLLVKFALMQICAHWRTTLEYATTRMTQVEWEVEDASKRHPDGRGLDGCLERLHRWRRVLPTYDAMVTETLTGILRADHRLFSPTILTNTDTHTMSLLRQDFQQVHEQITALQHRAERIVSLVGTLIHIDESKKAVQENESVFRLTCLLGVFVPMSFLSSLFSMTTDLRDLKSTLWIFFAISVPLTLLCLSAIALVGPGRENMPIPRIFRRKRNKE